jgi:type II secretory ATPase GspE/PulE/Tfp pilus assembly ATPase PilB-like protein
MSGAHWSIDAPQRVTDLLGQAISFRASDIHVEPTAQGYETRYRIDGLLHTVEQVDSESGRAIVGRLMVLAHLLTYRLDIPQEGRFSFEIDSSANPPLDLRLAIMPTTHGLRAAIRLPAELTAPGALEDLALPVPALAALKRFALADGGLLIVTGPAGSGKTTTLYALLRHIATSQPGLSIISLEDPVEREIPGVTQIEVKPFGQLTYERAMRSILRQDPQVLMLGEIRDAGTASLALQAALSGHRLICTLHAADPAGAIARLFEMGMEPHQITSALYGVLTQRLLRRRVGGGYSGRIPVAEFMANDGSLRQAILDRADADKLREIGRTQPGYLSMLEVARALVQAGQTDLQEVQRVLGGK